MSVARIAAIAVTALVCGATLVPSAGAHVSGQTDRCVRWGPTLRIDKRAHGLVVRFVAVCPYGWARAGFIWDFGEPGSDDTAVTPRASHVYTTVGRHRVVLMVIDPTFHLRSVRTTVVLAG